MVGYTNISCRKYYDCDFVKLLFINLIKFCVWQLNHKIFVKLLIIMLDVDRFEAVPLGESARSPDGAGWGGDA